MQLALKIPIKLKAFEKPCRYKIAHGGRGGCKSWGIARLLICKSVERRLKILCAREIQDSIKESVHTLLVEQIALMGLTNKFRITDKEIECIDTGSMFIFKGLSRNITTVKSYEGTDICWVEEAEAVTDTSWEILTPTIRKKGSEIWISFNPKHADDATYRKFVVDPPTNSVVVEINYWDNPWFRETELVSEMEQDKARDYLLYQNKWCGKPVGTGGKVFPSFDKNIHVKSYSWDFLKDNANCFMSMDPHSNYFHACVWIAIFPKNNRMKWPEDFHKHVYNEWPKFDDLGSYYHDVRTKKTLDKTMKQVATEIYSRDGAEYGLQIISRAIDTRYAKGSGAQRWNNTTEGIVELFAKEENGGLSFMMPREKIIDGQREVIRTDMSYNKLMPIGPFNQPGFSVDPRCRNMIAALTHHRLEEDKEKEAEKYKDFSDALRIDYAGINDIDYVKPGQNNYVEEEYLDHSEVWGTG